MRVDTSEITVEQAHAVLSAHSKVVQAERAAEGRKLLGRFFKHREHAIDDIVTFGSKDYRGPSTWWMYAQVTEVSDWGSPSGWTFQRKPKSIEVRPEDSLHFSTDSVGLSEYGWMEVPASEFWGAAMAVRDEAFTRLTEQPR